MHNFLAGIADLKSKVHNVPILVAVRGHVWTDSPLKCELTEKPAVIAEVRTPEGLERVSRPRHRRCPGSVLSTWQASLLPVAHFD